MLDRFVFNVRWDSKNCSQTDAAANRLSLSPSPFPLPPYTNGMAHKPATALGYLGTPRGTRYGWSAPCLASVIQESIATMPRQSGYSICLGVLAFLAGVLAFHHAAFPAGPLPEFAYRTMTLVVAGPDGKPVPNAAVYGFCRQLNLVWPRPAKAVEKWNHLIRWHESFLGSTGPDGMAKVVVPPGKWAFFAAAIFPRKTTLSWRLGPISANAWRAMRST